MPLIETKIDFTKDPEHTLISGYGETFVYMPDSGNGNDFASLSKASANIWRETAKKWKTTGLSGLELFKYADDLAKTIGCNLNPLMAGHRLGDFPHALFSNERLFSLDFVPSENLWVLEIHVTSPSLQRGAFFEDILI